MQYRVIPILPSHATTLDVRAPVLSGEPDRLSQVLAALEAALRQELNLHLPRHAWLRELRLNADEAYLALTPNLCAGDLGPAEVAFSTLRRLLPDTDIYIGASGR